LLAVSHDAHGVLDGDSGETENFETKLGGNYTETLEEHDRGAPEEIRITVSQFAVS